jgi:hypothetical protein
VTAVIRPNWTPDTEEQRLLLAEARRLARKAEQAERAMWLGVLRARLAGVADEALCEHPAVSRATLNRRYGSRKRMGIQWTGDNFDEIQTLRPDARLTDNGDLLVEHADGSGPVVVGLHQVVHKRDDSRGDDGAPTQ